jgi:hypothetical protein
MGYAEAIEQQAARLNHFRSPAGRKEISDLLAIKAHELNTQTIAHRTASEAAQIFHSALCTNLSTASPFFVSSGICQFIDSAAIQLRQIERQTFNANDLPVPVGYCLFESSISVEDDREMVALSWSLVQKDGHVFLPAVAPQFATHLQMFPWLRHPKSPSGVSWIGSYLQLPLGQISRMQPQDGVFDTERFWKVATVLLTLCEFLRQHILQTSNRVVTNRQARRRIAKSLEHEPTVNVVELRRREYQQRDESHDAHIEYSCQWLVRGHWRQQYFPASGEHRPLWIAPHI